MFLADGAATCAVHPELAARAACTRCGTFACDACLTGDSRDSPMCETCDARMATEGVPRVTSIALVARISGLVFAAAALADAIVVIAGGDQESILFGLVNVLLLLAGGTLAIFFVVWIRRANTALRNRGMQLEFGPNSWGWFFAPIMNLYKPYQAVRELYTRASGELVASHWLTTWWAAWIVGNLGSRFAFNSEGALQTIDAVMLAILAIAAGALTQIIRATTAGLAQPRPSGLKVALFEGF